MLLSWGLYCCMRCSPLGLGVTAQLLRAAHWPAQYRLPRATHWCLTIQAQKWIRLAKHTGTSFVCRQSHAAEQLSPAWEFITPLSSSFQQLLMKLLLKYFHVGVMIFHLAVARQA